MAAGLSRARGVRHLDRRPLLRLVPVILLDRPFARGAFGQVGEHRVEQSLDPLPGRAGDREDLVRSGSFELGGEARGQLGVGEIDLVERDQLRLVLLV
jgi:hypothetical protein